MLKQGEQKQEKKTYTAPKLTVYGNIQDLTKATFSNRTLDGRTFFIFQQRTNGR